nr:serine hydrolase [uncultured Psychroserpens sp.]
MSSTVQIKTLYFTAIYCFFLIHYPLLANNSNSKAFFSNGAQAYAYPISSIVIDGNSNDWPSTLEKHPIAISPYGTLPENEDFEAYFQVGHNLNEQALYILVKVIDNNHIVDSNENAAWNTQDTYTLYLDYKHEWNGSGVNLFQVGENFKGHINYDTSWDPDTKKMGWDKVMIKTSRLNTTTTYEIKVILGNHLKLNKTIGIDHVIVDKDNDDEKGIFSFISWGARGGKSGASVRLGDIIPVAENTKVAEVKGKVLWDDVNIKKMTDRIALVNKKYKKQWSIAEVDSLGNYNTMLPQGSYIIKPFWEFRDQHRIDLKNSKSIFEVEFNNINTAPDLKLLTKGHLDLIPEKGIIQDFNPDDASELDNFIAAYQDYYVIPGVSLAIIKDGKIVYHKTYGYKNTVTEKAVDDNTLFEAASITKPVFAFAVCRLVEKKIIDLDRPLYTYLPFEDIAHDERYKLITARHVLTHQTGFPNWAWMNPDRKIDIKFTPGTSYGYSGEGFEYLKRVVTKITGKDIETILREEVLIPLSLKNTYFSENDYLKTHVSNGHYGRFPTKADLPKEPGMASTMHTEAKSFASFALGLLERKGLKPDTYKEMFTIHTTRDSEIPKEGWEEYFGLGIAMEKTPFGPTFGHGGNNGDFRCKFKIYSELNAGFIIFTNNHRGHNLHDALDEFLITGKVKD